MPRMRQLFLSEHTLKSMFDLQCLDVESIEAGEKEKAKEIL